MEETLLMGGLAVFGGIVLVIIFRILPNMISEDGGKIYKTSALSAGRHSSVSSASEAMSVDDEYRFNFRRARWGMTREQVKSHDDFTGVVMEDHRTVFYNSRLGHMNCKVSYCMGEGDTLVGGRYEFTSVYEDGNRYTADFNTLLELYKDRFGAPLSLETVWNNQTFEKRKDFHGIAFMEGHMERRARWITPRTGVVLFLGHDAKGDINFFIEYKGLERGSGENAVSDESAVPDDCAATDEKAGQDESSQHDPFTGEAHVQIQP